MSHGVSKREIVIARIGEIALKGLNRGKFEQRLIQNLSRRLRTLGPIEILRRQSRIWIIPGAEDIQLEDILERATTVFGVVSASPAWEFTGGMNEIQALASDYMQSLLTGGQPTTFNRDCI